MNRSLYALVMVVLLAILAFSSVARSEIVVRIVDAPSHLLLYSPVFIVFSVENKGKSPELVPVGEGLPGWYLELSDPNGHLVNLDGSYGSRAYDPIAWLKPGEKLYFYKQLSRPIMTAGVYEIRARLSSSGTCRLFRDEERAFPVRRLLTDSESMDPAANFECWKGEISSETTRILVDEPGTKLDLEVLEYVKKNGKDLNIHYALGRCYHHLNEHYPGSYYTFVAGMHYVSDDIRILEEIMEVQPNHELAPYARLKWAIIAIHNSCSESRPDGKPIEKVAISELDLRPEVREFLEQYQQTMHHEARLREKEKTAKKNSEGKAENR